MSEVDEIGMWQFCSLFPSQEFVDARKRQDLQNAPPVLFSTREPPLELRHLNLKDSEEMSYITFGRFIDDINAALSKYEANVNCTIHTFSAVPTTLFIT